jgi:hypothetical protein
MGAQMTTRTGKLAITSGRGAVERRGVAATRGAVEAARPALATWQVRGN